MIVILKALELLGLKPQDARVVIQGFGNVGGMAAKLMSAIGFKIVCVVESTARSITPTVSTSPRFSTSQGDRLHHRLRGRRRHGQGRSPVSGVRGADPRRHGERDPFGNADRIRCKILCEAPTAYDSPGRRVLADKKIFVIPDILANAGGVTVSYFEWVQDRQASSGTSNWSTSASRRS